MIPFIYETSSLIGRTLAHFFLEHLWLCVPLQWKNNSPEIRRKQKYSKISSPIFFFLYKCITRNFCTKHVNHIVMLYADLGKDPYNYKTIFWLWVVCGDKKLPNFNFRRVLDNEDITKLKRFLDQCPFVGESTCHRWIPRAMGQCLFVVSA